MRLCSFGWPAPALLLLLLLLCAEPAAGQAVPHPFSFSVLPGVLPPVVDGSARWGDLDGDGDMDLVVVGTEPVSATVISPRPASRLFRNEGRRADPQAPGGFTVRFTEIPAGLLALAYGDAALGDYDRDGDLDLVIAGTRSLARPYAPATRLYRNDGTGRFTDTGLNLPALHSGSVRWADLDRDGRLDLVLCGTADAEGPYTGQTLVLLQGTGGTFAVRADAGLPGIVFGRFRLADLDGDGVPDFAGQGLTAAGPMLVAYRNDGTGRFSLLRQTAGGVHADVEVADFDADRTLDYAAGGARPGPFVFAGSLRRLVASGNTFSQRQMISREGVGSRLAAGDYNGDGRPDLAVMAAALRPDRATVGVYTLVADTFALRARLFGDFAGALAWGDADGDGDLDLVASASVGGAIAQLNLYRNERFDRSQPPPVPAATPVLDLHPDGTLMLTWPPPAAEGSFTYDVRIGTTPGGSEVRRAEADADGRRLQSADGPLRSPALALSGLAPGTYYVGVQAVGADFVGSAFAEQAVEVRTGTGVMAPETGAPFLALPSPVRGETRVRFRAHAGTPVELAVYDVLGRRVLTLADGPGTATTASLRLDAGALPPGLYVLRLEQGPLRLTRSFFVVR
jgi:hypothetical protein